MPTAFKNGLGLPEKILIYSTLYGRYKDQGGHMSTATSNVIKLFSLCLLSAASLQAYSASYQIFTDHDYESPTAIAQTKKFSIELGDTSLWSSVRFKGTSSSGLFSGSTSSHTSSQLVYGQANYRLSPMFVVGLNVTQPLWTNIQYPKNSFVRFNSTSTFIRAVDYSPRVAFQPNKNWTFGVGFDAMDFFNGQLNFAIPPTLAPFGVLTNKATAWGYGGDAGITYFMEPGSIFTLSYYSKIRLESSGTSTWGPFKTHLTANIISPAVWSANIIQYLSKTWLVSGTVEVQEWDDQDLNLTLHNTAIGTDVVIPNHLYNGVVAILGSRYQYNDSWAGIVGLTYSTSDQPHEFRTVGLPNPTYWVVALGPEYTWCNNIVVKAMYGYVWGDTHINNMTPTGLTNGRAHVNNNALDVSITYKM